MLSTLGNIVWFVLAGWWLAIIHVLLGLALTITITITIIGPPFAWAHLKLAGASLAPLGKKIAQRVIKSRDDRQPKGGHRVRTV